MNRVLDFILNSNDDDKMMFANDINSLIMDLYFTKYWKDNSMSFSKSGKNLVEVVNQLNPESVLDVGCGNNNFKGLINNLIGIDPFNAKADVNATLFKHYIDNPEQQFDVVLALDSVNCGRRPDIIESFDLINRITKQGGYQFWRVDTGVPECKEFPMIDLLDFFEWNEKLIRNLAEYNGFEVKELCEETNDVGEKRLFFCFYKY